MTVHTAAYSELWQKYLQPNRTLKSQLTDKQLAEGAEYFMTRRDQLENAMKLLVSNRSGRGIVTVQDKVNSLIDSSFHEYVKSQHDLFTDAGVFAPADTAYHTV
jgi:hypothetical protein